MKLFVHFRFNREKFLKVNEESYILFYSFIKKIIIYNIYNLIYNIYNYNVYI